MKLMIELSGPNVHNDYVGYIDCAKRGRQRIRVAANSACLAPEPEPAPEPVSQKSTLSKDQLIHYAKEMGIEVDGRWGVDRINEEIQKAQNP